MHRPIISTRAHPACTDGLACPAAARIADHVKLEEKYDGMKKSLMELFGARRAQSRLLKHAYSSKGAGGGIVLGSLGSAEEAADYAEKRFASYSRYEKGMIYAAIGADGTEKAEQQLASMALYLKAGGLAVPPELTAKAQDAGPAMEPSEALVKSICIEASLLVQSIDSLSPKVAMGWATALFSQGLFAEAGLIAAKAQDRSFAIKCTVELMLKANALFHQKAERQLPEYYGLVAEAGMVLAEIGNYDEARRKARVLRGRPLLQGRVLARCDDAASKTAAWDIAMKALEKRTESYAASEIFSILGDALRAAEATPPVTEKNGIWSHFALLRAAKACRASLALSEAACRKISQADFEQIVLEAKACKDESFLGKLMTASPQMFACAVASLQLQP